MTDFAQIKKDFPIFSHHKNLIYLDSTATSLKPLSVIHALEEYYKNYSANIYRGIYPISEKATQAYELTRELVARFIQGFPEEVIFTRNTSESLNLIAYALGEEIVHKDDEITVSIMEHHSNFVPWQELCKRKHAVLHIIPINRHGELCTQKEALSQYISKKTKILAITHISNVLGTINDVKQIINVAKKINPTIITVVDGAQSIPHMRIDVKDLGCDFFACSGHKMVGPTGVGILWGKKRLLEQMRPFLYGGEMISEVSVVKTLFKEAPFKFEAGTPAIGEVIALGKAIEYLSGIGMKQIQEYEKSLVQYAYRQLIDSIPQISIIGPKERAGIISFTIPHVHPHDIAHILGEKNICVRAGSHCAMPLHQCLHLGATVRASFYMYNSTKDVDIFVDTLKSALDIFT